MASFLFWIAVVIALLLSMTFSILVYGQEGTGYDYISQQLQDKDKFGIAELYPTVRDGREWFSYWGNGY